MNDTQTQLDQDAVNLAKAIRQSESGGDFKAKGKSNEYGAYQFTPDTWNASSMKYLKQHVPLEQATKEQQNEVAYKQIKEWKDKGYNPGQIASMWNAGADEPDAYKGTFSNGHPAKGTNKFGASFDVPAYAKSVATAYHTIKGGGNVGVDQNNPSSIVNQNIQAPELPKQYQQNQPTEEDNLKANTATQKGVLGVPGSVLNVLGNITGTKKLGEGAGYGIANTLYGNSDNLNKALNQAIDIQTDLLNKIKINKAKGKDTTKLKQSLNQITQSIKDISGQVETVGTGGVTKGQALGSAVQTLATIGTVPSLIKGGIGLLSGLKGGSALASPVAKQAIKDYGISNLETASGKFNALVDAVKFAEPGQKTILEAAIKELGPQVLKEAGVGSFAELNPGIAKILGLGKGAFKTLFNLGKGYLGYKGLEDVVSGFVSKK